MLGAGPVKDDVAMKTQNRRTSFLYGGNAPYVEELYESYLSDPTAVSAEWRAYFDALRDTPAVDGNDVDDVAHGPIVDRFVEIARGRGAVAAVGPVAASDTASARKHLAVQALVNAYRMVGTRKARLDPLHWTPIATIPDLAPAFYGLTSADLPVKFGLADVFFSDEDIKLADLLSALEETYCGTLGAEFMHLTDANQRRWWQMRLESRRSKATLPRERKLHILERLTAAEGLEKYLHVRYAGQKRFSLEGGEALIVLLDELIQYGATQGIKGVVMGMAHRGRLNVLINTVGKPAAALFDEFDGKTANLLPAGDVKYHKGYTGNAATPNGPVEVTLAFNPSHLEFINPVVQGIARAKGEALGGAQAGAVLPVEIHGDAAITGQGIVMETLSLTHTRGHGTGGTIHVVVNNQVGFTTSDPSEARSSFYCSDIAKMIEAPVLHVNGDDPEAVVLAVQLALEFRTTFKQSVMIDLVCFRRHGHQEQDTPNITQPLMYRAISSHPGARALYARKLVDERVVTAEEAEGYALAYRNSLEKAKGDADAAFPDRARELGGNSGGAASYAAPSLEQLHTLAQRVTEVPQGYALHPLVSKMMGIRREMAAGTRALDWGMGEHLAFASLLAAGTDVRLSGEDSERGTFSHRHAVLNDQNRQDRGEGRYIPLDHVQAGQGRFTVNNSILSEAAVMGFEYGYSLVRPDALVLWEAQFGDFANGAQVVIDQFIAPSAVKWGQHSGLTLLLPHGQEGQGPEHASARLERYLQLCAQDNMQVVQPTTPAQFFHLLRIQAQSHGQRPLIVMTPKSLLRHPEATSTLEELASGTFQQVLGDRQASGDTAAAVKRVILSSGKVYYDLLAYRAAHQLHDVALVRLEQLYPFPAERLAAELALYGNADTVVWCQEEAHNQGAWKVIDESLRALVPASAVLRYAGPPAWASTAPGYASTHMAQHKMLVAAAFGQGESENG
jgi:2-oxoglutarate dehydrogenase E1 component